MRCGRLAWRVPLLEMMKQQQQWQQQQNQTCRTQIATCAETATTFVQAFLRHADAGAATLSDMTALTMEYFPVDRMMPRVGVKPVFVIVAACTGELHVEHAEAAAHAWVPVPNDTTAK